MEIKEKKVMIRGEFPIAATVTYTDESKKSPAIVIIMGTGKLDRDGNGFGFKSNIYKDLAEAFTKNGFVTARYDKRGTHRSGGSFSAAGLSDLVNDAAAVTRYLKEQPYVDENRVVICGHSEGTMIATLLAEKEDTAGLILLGGAGMCLKDALYYQNTLLADEISRSNGVKGAILRKLFKHDKQLATVDEMFRKSSETTKEKVYVQGAGMPAKWLREHGSYTSEDFAEKLKRYGKPVLAVTGQADVQADHRRLDALKGEDHIRLYTPERLTHMLKSYKGEYSILNIKKIYRELIKEPLDEDMLGVMTDWLSVFAV